jgi:predicted ATPase
LREDIVPIEELHVAGYRSIRTIRVPLQRINVLVGPNGCGKTNLYRAMYLVGRAAEGQLARTLAEEGGFPSALWSGERYKGPVRMTLEVSLDKMDYRLSCGLPNIINSAFVLDPEIKEEDLWFRDGKKKVSLLERRNGSVRARNAEGQRAQIMLDDSTSESVLAELREPAQFPVLAALRQEFLSWRFYHQFRTDPASPIRQPQVGVRAPILGHDGRDLAAALQTILEVGDASALNQHIQAAFPGARLKLDTPPQSPRFGLNMFMPGIPRPFDARELSDGTLQYLCLLAAFLSPRPAALLAVNEPEASIHPDLLEPLARLIVDASRFSQIWLTTHSEALCAFIKTLSGTEPMRLEKVNGETRVAANRQSALG